MPLRVLGHCGGYSSDVADAIQWAAGGEVPGVPTNPNPVEVINLSLGGEEVCIAPLQTAIDFAVSRGVVVVVSAGNADRDVSAWAEGAQPVGPGAILGDRRHVPGVSTRRGRGSVGRDVERVRLS